MTTGIALLFVGGDAYPASDARRLLWCAPIWLLFAIGRVASTLESHAVRAVVGEWTPFLIGRRYW